MPVSKNKAKGKKAKKRDKKYRQKVVSLNCFRKSDIEDVYSQLSRVELTASLKLHKGESTLDELHEVRDLFNATCFGCLHRKDAITDDGSVDAVKFIMATGVKLANLCRRGAPYVCWADELKDIQEALAICTDFVRDSLDTCPSTFLAEFNGSILVRDAVRLSRQFSVSDKTVNAAYKAAVEINRLSGKEYERAYESALKSLKEMVSVDEKCN